ncbi:hypothetical protein ABZ845_30830 [Streptomyces sp. NPDC047022]|uniref:hypothetical protein n=1 Tax=Streptomyces sp. NPDC047022 TaxID=3155737 RepID=UPI0033E908E3
MTAADELRAVTRGSGSALVALWSGSMILGSKLCRCAGAAGRWAWEQARTDTTTQDDAGEEAVRRRPVLEALGMLALSGALAAGALGTLAALALPYLRALAPWRGAAVAVGTLAWMVAAWMVAPAAADDAAEDGAGDALMDDDAAPAPADVLGRHVVASLAELEAEGRSGIHVTALIASAEAAGILAPGSTDKATMRAWLTESGFPVTKSVKVAGSVDYGLRVDRLREAIGAPPGTTLAQLIGGGPEDPASGPVPAPAGAALPAAAGPLSGRLLSLVKPLPEGDGQEDAEGAA